MGLHRGTVSKVMKRLGKEGLVTTYQEPDNRKEIYFHLTDKGRQFFEHHERQHEEWERRDEAFFRSQPPERLEAVMLFLQEFNGYLAEHISLIKRNT